MSSCVCAIDRRFEIFSGTITDKASRQTESRRSSSPPYVKQQLSGTHATRLASADATRGKQGSTGPPHPAYIPQNKSHRHLYPDRCVDTFSYNESRKKKEFWRQKRQPTSLSLSAEGTPEKNHALTLTTNSTCWSTGRVAPGAAFAFAVAIISAPKASVSPPLAMLTPPPPRRTSPKKKSARVHTQTEHKHTRTRARRCVGCLCELRRETRETGGVVCFFGLIRKAGAVMVRAARVMMQWNLSLPPLKSNAEC